MLNAYTYFTLYNKQLLIKHIRIWKSKYSEESAYSSLQEIDTKYSNFTHYKINAEYISVNEDTQYLQLHEINISDNDILIIELPKNFDNFVFAPM